MTRWSSKEIEVLSNIVSINEILEDKLTYKYLSKMWNVWYSYFPERSSDSIRHKFLEINGFNIKDKFLTILKDSEKEILTIDDLIIEFDLPSYLIELMLKALEKKYNVEFYDSKCKTLTVEATLKVFEKDSKVIHAKQFFDKFNETLKMKECNPNDETYSSNTYDDSNSNSKDFVKLQEWQLEFNDPHTSKSRKKTLKRKIKKLSKFICPPLSKKDEDKISVTEPSSSHTYSSDSCVEAPVNFKIGVIADTHIGSKYFDSKALNAYYDICEEEGIDRVIHAGDLFDGSSVYAYHELDQDLVGYKNQFNWIVRNYPKRKNIYTFIISGNHDMNIFKKESINPIMELAKVRNDIIYSGDYYTSYDKMGVKINVIHCDGLNLEPMTKMKKLIDSFTMDYDIFIMGHLHQAMELHNYGRVKYAVMPGCFIKANHYTIRKGYTPAIGGFILDVTKSGDTVSVKSRWVNCGI